MSADVTIPEETPLVEQAEQARTLHAVSTQGVLATLDPKEGYPYASLVELLPTPGGDVVFLLSTLAVHTTNLSVDPRASVLLTDPFSHDRPLTRQRMTLMGQLARDDDQDQWRDAYLEVHPGAEVFIDFTDFSFYRLSVARARYIGGFGRMSWVELEAWSATEPDIMAASLRGVVEHMNDDHVYNMVQYAQAFAKLDWATGARMLWADRHGFDMEVTGDHEASPATVRLGWRNPLARAGHIRMEMVHMANEAREILGIVEE